MGADTEPLQAPHSHRWLRYWLACCCLYCSAWLPQAGAQPQPPEPGSLMARIEAVERGRFTNTAKSIAELQEVLAKAQPASDEALVALLQLGAMHLRVGDAVGLQSVRQALELARDGSDGRHAKRAAVSIALLGYTEAVAASQFGAARDALDSVSDLNFAELPLLWQLAYVQASAKVSEQVGEMDKALALRLQAVTLAEQSKSTWRHAAALNNLVFVYLEREDLTRGLQAAEQALALTQTDANIDELARVHNSISMVQTDMGQFAAARDSLVKAIDYAERSDPRLHGMLVGNLADIYLRWKDYPQALRTAQEALPLARAVKDRSGEALAIHNIGLALIGMARVAEGKAQVQRAIAMEQENGALTIVSESYQELGEYLEQAGDLEGALQAFEQYRKTADEQDREDRRKALLEAQQQFDDSLKRAQTKALAQATQLQAKQIEARKLQLVLWSLLVGSGVATIVLLALLTRRTRAANAALASSNADLADRSERDPLTNVGNRHQLQRLLSARGGGANFQGVLLLIDVDHFKQINDQYGHAGGDQVLIELAQRLRAAAREGDAVLRWGGEEFLLLTEVSEDGGAALAQRVLSSAAMVPVRLADGREVALSVSIGFARFPLLQGSADVDLVWEWEQALALVDQLMYRAKALGRNQAWTVLGSRAASAAEVAAQLVDVDNTAALGELVLQQWRGPVAGELKPGAAP